MNDLLSKIKDVFFLNKIESNLYNYFHTLKKDNKSSESKQVILIQNVEDLAYFSIFASVVMKIQEGHNVLIKQYISRSVYASAFSNFRSFIASILLDNSLHDRKWINIYKSFCESIAFKFIGSTSILSDIKLFMQAYKIFKELKTKEELLSLRVDEVSMGDLIYDTYIRFKPADTVNIKDTYLLIVIWQGLRNLYVSQKYFEQEKPLLFLNSYSTYIHHGVAVRAALKFGVKVVTFGNNNSIGKTLTLKDYYHHQNHDNYKNDFLLQPNQKAKLELSKKALLDRFSGIIDNATLYMKKSAYLEVSKEVPNVENKLIIFLHYFQDSPHGYELTFNDFLEWTEFTIEFLQNENIPFCLKTHPNKILENKRSIAYLNSKYKNLSFISEDITNKQLIQAGMKAGVSVRGTVAHELVYQGIPAILCGDNPHGSYDFIYEAKSIDSYKQLLLNYKNLDINESSKEEVESFYYMHNLNFTEDERILLGLLNQLKRNLLSPEERMNNLKEIMDNEAFHTFVCKLI